MKKLDSLFDTQIYNSLRELDKGYYYFHFKNIFKFKNFDEESLRISCKACFFCLQMKNISNDEFFICTNILNKTYEENKKCRFLDYKNIYKDFDELIAFWITKALELFEDEKKIEQKNYPDLNIFNVSLKKKIENFLSKLIPVCTNFLPFLKDKAVIEFYKIIYKRPKIIKKDLTERFEKIHDLRIKNQIQKLINKRENDPEIDNVLFGLILSYIVPACVSEKIIDFLFKNLKLVYFINFDCARIVMILENKNIDFEFKIYLLQEKIDPKFYSRKKILDFIIEFQIFNSLEFRNEDMKIVFDGIWDFVVQNNNPPLENSKSYYEKYYKKNERCIKDSINKLNLDNKKVEKDLNHINKNINNLSIQKNEEHEILFLKKVARLIKKTLRNIDILPVLEKKVDHKILFNFLNKLNFDIRITEKYLERNFRKKNSNLKIYFLDFKIEGNRVKEVEFSYNLHDKKLMYLIFTEKFEIPSFIFENLSLLNFYKLLFHFSPRITLITRGQSTFKYSKKYSINILDNKYFKDSSKNGIIRIKYPAEIKNENKIIECIRYVIDVYRYLHSLKIYKQGIKDKLENLKIDSNYLEDEFTFKKIKYNQYSDYILSILKEISLFIFENVKSEFILNKNNEKDCLIHKNCNLKNIISIFYKKNKKIIFWDGLIQKICIFCIPLSILKKCVRIYYRIPNRKIISEQINFRNKIKIFKKMNKNVEILDKKEIFTLFLNLKGFYSLEVFEKIYNKVNNNEEYENDFIELLKEIYFLIKNAPKLNVSDNEDKCKLFLSEIDKVNENIILMRKKINQECKICKDDELNLEPFFYEKLIRVLRLNNSLQKNHDISDEDKKYIFKQNT